MLVEIMMPSTSSPSSYYGELKDYDGPPVPSNRRDSSSTRLSSTERRSLPRTSEVSLNLDDLEAEIQADFAAATTRTASMDDLSGFTLAAWNHEPEATTGNLAASFLNQHRSSLSSVWEIEHTNSDSDNDDEEDVGEDYYTTYKTAGRDDDDDDDDDESDDDDDNDNDFRSALSSLSIGDCGRPSLPLMDDEEKSSSTSSSTSPNDNNNNKEKKGCLHHLNTTSCNEEISTDTPSPSKKVVHFEVPARLEDIQEYEKPDTDDYSNLYYMAHEIQKMMDEFKIEDQLNRHVLR
jgi:hypothetical protein